MKMAEPVSAVNEFCAARVGPTRYFLMGFEAGELGRYSGTFLPMRCRDLQDVVAQRISPRALSLTREFCWLRTHRTCAKQLSRAYVINRDTQRAEFRSSCCRDPRLLLTQFRRRVLSKAMPTRSNARRTHGLSRASWGPTPRTGTLVANWRNGSVRPVWPSQFWWLVDDVCLQIDFYWVLTI